MFLNLTFESLVLKLFEYIPVQKKIYSLSACEICSISQAKGKAQQNRGRRAASVPNKGQVIQNKGSNTRSIHVQIPSPEVVGRDRQRRGRSHSPVNRTERGDNDEDNLYCF